MPGTKKPRYPIIYVRGYAMTQSEIMETTSTPYMGFELGSTKIRQQWDRTVKRLFFESPIVRLRKDYDYEDIYREGVQVEDGTISPQTVVIHRYYDQADPDFGDGKVPSIQEAATQLGELILKVRDLVCTGGQMDKKAFKVYLVAHSMGGLVVRCFLQNAQIAAKEARDCVDKVFTFATPHNGIEMGGINVPGFFALWDMDNFNRDHMRKYLDISKPEVPVHSLDGKFPPERFFCLVGTNSKDYGSAGGASRLLAGELSDGLVRIQNAYVDDAPRAHVYRSHSGAFGIVNSEEGYQNLTRFLFGDIEVEGLLELESLPLPPAVQKEADKGKTVNVGYYFEVAVSVRGAVDYDLTRRSVSDQSAIQRTRQELVDPKTGKILADARQPQLFSVFLDSTRRPPVKRDLVFTVQLAVSTSSYEVGDTLLTKSHIPGEYLFRNTIQLSAMPPDDPKAQWKVRFVLTDTQWSGTSMQDADFKDGCYDIPLENDKGFKARLRLAPRPWN
jgi:hypothetical protein